MKNKLTDLNNHLFAALERLNDEEMDVEQLTKEIERAKAIANLGAQIINSANTTLKAAELLRATGYDYGSQEAVLQLTGKLEPEDKNETLF